MKSFLLLLGLLAVSIFAQDCLIVVPPNPLSATGLATPYQLMNCNQSDPMMASFVQGAILDVNTGNIFVYNPLVITQGTVPFVAPIVPKLPATPVIGLWFGTNGCTLTLVDNGGSLTAGSCVNGLAGSIFGQFSYCNAVLFFNEATALIGKGLIVPPLGTANDGQPCPTVRDFFVVDQDQSDNVVTSYLNVGAQTMQDTTANAAANPNAVRIINGSDNRLTAIALDGAMGCNPMKGLDLADTNTNSLPALPYNEILAAVNAPAPQALVPLSHAMTRVNNQPSVAKTNAYRAGVGQNPTAIVNGVVTNGGDSVAYCTNIYYTAPARLLKNAANFVNFPSPDPNVATNLYAFMAQRFQTTFGPDGLNCASDLNVAPPVIATKNMGGLFVGAQIIPPTPVATGTTNTGLATNTIIIIVVCTIAGAVLLIGLVVGVIWYRNRSMYS
jgi:hypothetical protein